MPAGLTRLAGPAPSPEEECDPQLQLAHRAEVFIELSLIVASQPVLELTGVFHDEVQDAQFIAFPLLATGLGLAFDLVRKEAFEDQARVDLLGHGQRFRFPGKVRRVRTAVPRIAIARIQAALDSQLQRGEARLLTDLLGGELVHRDAGLDIRAVRLPWLPAGQEGRHGPRMIAGAISMRPRLVGGEPAQNQERVLDRRVAAPGSGAG